MVSEVVDQPAGKAGYHQANAAGLTAGQTEKVVSAGLTYEETAKLKQAIAAAIAGSISERKLSRRDAAAIIGVGQDKVSLVFRRRLRDFSIERLFKFLLSLGHDIEIVAAESPGSESGRIQFSVGRVSLSDSERVP